MKECAQAELSKSRSDINSVLTSKVLNANN